MFFMRQEIYEQPDIIANLLSQEKKHIFDISKRISDRNPKFIIITARGTSDNAARYAKYLFGTHLGIQVALATPSLFTLYKKPVNMRDALVIGISQSGHSKGAVAVLSEAQRQGAATLAITNNPDSPLASKADHTIETHAGVEQSVPATKTYTSQLTAIAMLAAGLKKDQGMLAELEKVPVLIRTILDSEDTIKKIALAYRYAELCVVFGRGYNYATAFEIALKLKETCYLAAEPFSPADYQHGPIALMEEGLPTIMVAPGGAALETMIEFSKELKKHGASIFMISDNDRALSLAELSFELPAMPSEWVSPIPSIVPGQLLALNLVAAKGMNPDQPRHLNKVTLTE